MRKQFAEPRSGLAVLREFEVRSRQWQRRLLCGHPSQPLATAHAFRKLFTVFLIEHRLVIEQVRLGGRAALKQINDPLRFRREIWESRQTTRCLLFSCSGDQLARKQAGQRNRSQAFGGFGKKMTPRNGERRKQFLAHKNKIDARWVADGHCPRAVEKKRQRTAALTFAHRRAKRLEKSLTLRFLRDGTLGARLTSSATIFATTSNILTFPNRRIEIQNGLRHF